MRPRSSSSLAGLALAMPAICSILIAASARADIIYESATLGTTGIPTGGVLLQGNQWPGARFTINTPVLVTGVGGHLTTLRGTLFATIVSLSSPSAFPSFSTADIESNSLASTTFANGAPSNDYITPLSVLLPAGNYGLIFGGGEGPTLTSGLPFGANGTGRMPEDNSLLPGASLFYASEAGTWENSTDPNAQWRFVVQGSIIPEPSSLVLAALGLFGLAVWGLRPGRSRA